MTDQRLNAAYQHARKHFLTWAPDQGITKGAEYIRGIRSKPHTRIRDDGTKPNVISLQFHDAVVTDGEVTITAVTAEQVEQFAQSLQSMDRQVQVSNTGVAFEYSVIYEARDPEKKPKLYINLLVPDEVQATSTLTLPPLPVPQKKLPSLPPLH